MNIAYVVVEARAEGFAHVASPETRVSCSTPVPTLVHW
jgi:hypothetical protein